MTTNNLQLNNNLPLASTVLGIKVSGKRTEAYTNIMRAVFHNNLHKITRKVKSPSTGMLRTELRMDMEFSNVALGKSIPSTASVYNKVLLENVGAGYLEATNVKGVYVPTTKWTQADQVEHTHKWAIINKQTREIEGYAESRRKAHSNKTSEQTVMQLN